VSIPNPDAVSAIAQLGSDAAAAEEVEPGKIYVFHAHGGAIQTVDLTDDKYLPTPRRKRGMVVVRDSASFLAYWNKHSDLDSEVYADRSKLLITGVLNAHEAIGPRFGDHHVVLQLQHSEQFAAWQHRSNYRHSQVEFAEFIEDHRADIRVPAAAELLELAQTFHATTKATFKSSNMLKSGQRQLEWVEQIDASAGNSGKLTIPDTFELGLPIFEGATEAEPVTARLRYRIASGGLGMIYILDQIQDVVNAAFEGVVAELAAGTTTDNKPNNGVGVPILRGTPIHRGLYA